MKDATQPNRAPKRPRASDAKRSNDDSGERVKRSRLSPNDDGQHSGQSTAPATIEDAGSRKSDPADWSLSHPLAGQYSNLDPAFTADEE